MVECRRIRRTGSPRRITAPRQPEPDDWCHHPALVSAGNVPAVFSPCMAWKAPPRRARRPQPKMSVDSVVAPRTLAAPSGGRGPMCSFANTHRGPPAEAGVKIDDSLRQSAACSILTCICVASDHLGNVSSKRAISFHLLAVTGRQQSRQKERARTVDTSHPSSLKIRFAPDKRAEAVAVRRLNHQAPAGTACISKHACSHRRRQLA